MFINSEPPRLNWGGQIIQGTVASFLVNGLIHPICTYKSRKMVGISQSLKGLYNGYLAIFATDSVTFSVNYLANNAFEEKDTLQSSITAGLASSPFVAVGEGLMANRQVNALSYTKAFKRACRINGWVMSACREIPFTIGVFYATPRFEKYLSDFDFAKEHPVITNITAGMTTGAVAGFLTTPFDLVKTVVQTSDAPKSIYTTTKVIVLKDGWKALFRGGILRACYVGLAGGGMNLVNHFLPENLPDSLSS